MTTRARNALLTSLLGLALAGCGGTPAPVPPPAGPASVAITTSTVAPLINTPVTITARVLRGDGSPVAAGTTVGFAATGGTLSGITTTDLAGDATAHLTSGSRGPVTVIVTAGTLPAGTATLTFIDPDEPFAVTLQAASATADVGAAVVLTARVTPAGVTGTGDPGATIADGAVVTFTASTGQVSSVTTTVGGSASATLAGIATPGIAWVTASAGSVESLPVLVEFIDPALPSSVTLAGLPPAGFTDAQGPVAVTATVLTLAGTPVPAGSPVAFAIVSGSGALSATEGSTDAAGRASVTVTSSVEGTVSVGATATGGVTGGLTVAFTNPSRPVALHLAASPASGRIDGQGPVLLTATVTPADPAHGRIADGTPVTFAVTAGSGTLSSQTVACAGGIASVALGSGVEGSVTVRAVAGLVSDVVTVVFTNPSRPAVLSLVASPASGRIDGPGPVTLTATVTPADPDLGHIADGSVVTFTVTAGSGTLSSQAASTTGGVAFVTLASAVEGSVTVRAAVAGSVTDAASVTFTNPSRPVALSLAANPPAGRIDGQPPVTLTATVTPADQVLGHVADGTPVTFTITAGSGTLSSLSATTTGGVASVTLASAVEGSVTVRAAVAGSVTDAATVGFTNPSRPAAVSLAASPSSGKTGGQGPVTLTATVTPADQVLGHVADGTPVTFAITTGSGTLSSPTAATTGGVASVTLDASAAGTVSVTASAGTAPAVTSPAVGVPFVTQPTLAIVTVRTTGTLPAGAVLGGVSAVVTASPAAGLTLAASDVAATGAAAGALLAANVADVAACRLALISATGFQPGELATLTFHVAAGTFPTANDFAVALTGPGVIDLGGVTVPVGVAIQGVTIF